MTRPLPPIELSLANSYLLRKSGITYVSEGVQIDPRALFTVQYQLLSVDLTPPAFGTWATGEWEVNPPTGSSGPFAVKLPVGVGQPAEANPGVEGVYAMWIQFSGTEETPAFPVGQKVKFVNP